MAGASVFRRGRDQVGVRAGCTMFPKAVSGQGSPLRPSVEEVPPRAACVGAGVTGRVAAGAGRARAGPGPGCRPAREGLRPEGRRGGADQLPSEVPQPTHPWAWDDDRCVRVRIDETDALVAVLHPDGRSGAPVNARIRLKLLWEPEDEQSAHVRIPHPAVRIPQGTRLQPCHLRPHDNTLKRGPPVRTRPLRRLGRYLLSREGTGTLLIATSSAVALGVVPNLIEKLKDSGWTFLAAFVVAILGVLLGWTMLQKRGVGVVVQLFPHLQESRLELMKNCSRAQHDSTLVLDHRQLRPAGRTLPLPSPGPDPSAGPRPAVAPVTSSTRMPLRRPAPPAALTSPSRPGPTVCRRIRALSKR